MVDKDRSRVAVIDYGMGNLRSVSNALQRLGASVVVTSDRHAIEKARAVVLPGVGAFGKCVENLQMYGLFDFVKKWLLDNRLFLGVCLGMQVLFEESEESPGRGMGFVPGKVKRFPGGLKVPHMGWNGLNFKKNSMLFQGIDEGEHFYFVHSYYCEPTEDVTIAATQYGIDFSSAIQKGNIYACQFHPEKSQKAGLGVLRNFLDLVKRQS